MASERIGTAVLELSTDSAGLFRDFDRVKKESREVDSEFEKLRRRAQDVGGDLKRAVERFEGRPLIDEARRVAQAVQQVGGVSKLTKKELQDVAATVQAATEKLRRMGEDVPPSIRKLSAELSTLDVASKKSAGGLSSLSGVARSLGPLLPVATIGGAALMLGRMATAAFDDAGALLDLSNRTGLSTDSLQEMQAVAAQTGTTLEAFTNTAFKLGVNIAEGSKKARDAVRDLGLEYEVLKAASPDEQFRMSVKALEAVENAQERNRLGMALFGKQWKEIAASIEEGYTGIANGAAKSSREQIEALDRAGDAWTKFKNDFQRGYQAILGSVVQGIQDVERAADSLSVGQKFKLFAGSFTSNTTYLVELEKIGAAMRAAEDAQRKLDEERRRGARLAVTAAEDHVEALARAKSEIAELSDVQRTQLNAALARGGDFAKEYAESINLSEEALRLYSGTAKNGKKETSDLQKAQESLFGTQSIDRANTYVTALGGVTNLSKLTADKKAELRAAVLAALEAYKSLGQQAPQALNAIDAATRPLLTSTKQLTFVPLVAGLESAEEAANKTGGSLYDLYSQSLPETAAATAAAEKETNDWALANGRLSPSLVDAATKARALGVEAKSLSDTLKDSLLATLQSVPGTITQALVSGGDLGAAAKSITSNLGSQLAKWAAAGLGATGPWGQAIAGAIGSLAPLISKLWGGPSKEILEARKKLEDFNATLAKTATAAQKNEAAMSGWGDKGALTLIQVRDALIAIGRSGAEASRLVEALWDTDNPARAAAAMEEVNRILEEQQRILEENTRDANTLFDEIMDAGRNGIPASMQPTIDRFIELGLLTDDQIAQLRALGQGGGASLEQLKDAASTLGTELEKLGPAFAQQKLDQEAAKVHAAITRLIDAGGDWGSTMMASKEELGSLVSKAKSGHLQLSESLRPFIEDLMATGNLINENGERITDLSGINWGPEMKTEAQIAKEGWDKILAAIDKLIAKITGPLETALDDVTRDRTINITPKVGSIDPETFLPPGDRSHTYPEDPGFASGVFRGQFSTMGTRVRLHGVESVVPKADEMSFAQKVLSEQGARITTNNSQAAILGVIMGDGKSRTEIGREAGRFLVDKGLAYNVDEIATAFSQFFDTHLLNRGLLRGSR